MLQQAVTNGSAADQAANMIFSHAYSTNIQPTQKNYARFIELIRQAKEFEVTTQIREQFDFWHAYSLYNRGMAVGSPETLETANRSLPMFQQALTLFRRSKGYADRTPSINYQQFVDARVRTSKSKRRSSSGAARLHRSESRQKKRRGESLPAALFLFPTAARIRRVLWAMRSSMECRTVVGAAVPFSAGTRRGVGKSG